jgi:outer membrane protein assembly factor BamD
MKLLMVEMILFAAKKFLEVELMLSAIYLGAKSDLMASYAYYSQDYYSDAISRT